MSKAKKLIIFFTLIFILFIIAIILIFKSEKPSKLKKIYNKLSSNQNYTFVMEEQDEEVEYKITMSQRDNDISIDMISNDEHTTTLVVKDHAYYINHDTEEYFTIDSEDIESEIIVSGLKDVVDKPYNSGKEEINGKVYYYEEYDDASTFYLFITENEEDNIKTRFYFDEENMVYIKNISSNEEIEPELLKVNLEYSAKEELFKIPE